MGTEETIFHEALARTDPRERAAFLDEACAGQPELRVAVESLLAASRPETSFLDKPALSVQTLEAVTQANTEGPGTVIGPYQLVEQIGKGDSAWCSAPSSSSRSAVKSRSRPSSQAWTRARSWPASRPSGRPWR